ncbi:MAG: hypothetical protein E6H10_15350 [Bacteroidetes bacterium]|nr:MAG: hypothetical protein E6H10_15350 [Bacteroidota bacterium]
MKKYLISVLLSYSVSHSQEVLHLQNGAAIRVQGGVELSLQGGITLDNGSGLTNNGIVRLKNNSTSNISNWTDNSAAGALTGTGIVIFNSSNGQNYSGVTNFYTVQVNTSGLNLNNNFTVSNLLNLINGKINTGVYSVFLNNNAASSLLNDAGNAGYANSWTNGNFRRWIASNTSAYDFPVGSSARSNLLQFINNNITGTSYLTAWFGSKPGTDAGLNVTESSTYYTGINNGGVWYLVPNATPSSGNYALQIYFNGFTGLADNKFGILRRPDASSNGADWTIPPGSSLEPNNGAGRKVSDGFARRKQISSFSQLGIGTLANVPNVVACSHPQGFYGNNKGTACYTLNGSSSTVNPTQLMNNAFVSGNSKVFGSIANRRFFTLFRSDINNGNIFKMLPGSGNSQALLVDNVLPYDGAYFSDQSTWSLVPILSGSSQNGKINNQLLSQLIALWFNISTSSTLGPIDLSRDTLVTTAQTACGSGIATGSPAKFGILHNVVSYLNGGNGYANSINGLFQLANDVLGGVNTSISPADAQTAVATINNAFDGCRILTGTIAYVQPGLMTKILNPGQASIESVTQKLLVTAFPNPYDRQFSLRIHSPESGMGVIDFFTANGTKIFEQRQMIIGKIANIVPYKGPHHSGALMYKITIGSYHASGLVIGIN